MTTTFAITGMTCGHCVKHVTAALKAVPGVTEVSVSLPTHTAVVTHDHADPDALVRAVADAGYEAAPAGIA